MNTELYGTIVDATTTTIDDKKAVEITLRYFDSDNTIIFYEVDEDHMDGWLNNTYPSIPITVVLEPLNEDDEDVDGKLKVVQVLS